MQRRSLLCPQLDVKHWNSSCPWGLQLIWDLSPKNITRSYRSNVSMEQTALGKTTGLPLCPILAWRNPKPLLSALLTRGPSRAEQTHQAGGAESIQGSTKAGFRKGPHATHCRHLGPLRPAVTQRVTQPRRAQLGWISSGSQGG